MHRIDEDEIREQLETERSDLRPLILYVCLHGVTESRATRDQVQEIPEDKRTGFSVGDFNMVARGIEPGCNPKLDKQRKIESVELTIEEIKQSVLMIIHHTKLGKLRERIGAETVKMLQDMGYLYVKDGERAFHIRGQGKAEFQHEIKERLVEAKKRKTAGEIQEIVDLLDRGDATYRALQEKHKNGHGAGHGNKYKKARNGKRKGKS